MGEYPGFLSINQSNVIASVELSETECYCSIYQLFLNIATRMGLNVAKNSLFNSEKIYVTKNIQGVLYSYYQFELHKSLEEIMAIWGTYGPYIYCSEHEPKGEAFKAYVEDEFIFNMRLNY